MVCSANPISDNAQILTEQQRESNLKYLKSFIASLERGANDYKSAELAHMGMPPLDEATATGQQKLLREVQRLKNMDEAHWQLVKLCRYFTPRRLTDALPSLEWLFNYQQKHMGINVAKQDLNLAVYMAIARADAGQSADAEVAFALTEQSIANNPDHNMAQGQILWMRAQRARNLRILDRAKEAIPIEKAIAARFNVEQHGWSPKQIRERVLGPGDSETNHPILKLIPWMHRCITYYIRLDQGRPYRWMTDKGEVPCPFPVLLQAIEQMKRDKCDPDNADITVLHWEGPKGPAETKFEFLVDAYQRHPPPLRQVTCLDSNGRKYQLPLLSDPFEINQEEIKECWLARCGKTKNLQRCSVCYTAQYCGAEHQKKAWKLHKLLCKSVYRVATVAEPNALGAQ